MVSESVLSSQASESYPRLPLSWVLGYGSDPAKVFVAELNKIKWNLELFCNFLRERRVWNAMALLTWYGFVRHTDFMNAA